MIGHPLDKRSSRRFVIGRLLVLAISGSTPPGELQQQVAGWGPAGVDELLLAASRHGVTRWLAQALLASPGLDPAARQRVIGAANRALRDHLRITSHLPMIAQTLDELGVPWLAFKGPVLAEAAYRRPDLREYVDLDIMVPPGALTDALDALERLGCRLVGRDWATLGREEAGQLTLQTPGGALLDLHWELFNDPRVRRSFPVPGAHELVAAGRRLSINDVRLLTLSPIDTVVHTALHACTSGGWRLLWLKDVEQAVLALDSDADGLAARAHEWGAGLAVAVMLQRAVRLLGLSPPEGLLSALARRSVWPHAVAVVDRLAPIERRTGAGSLTRIVTNSTRCTTGRSTLELARRSGEFAIRQVPGALGEREPGQARQDGRVRQEFLAAAQRRAWRERTWSHTTSSSLARLLPSGPPLDRGTAAVVQAGVVPFGPAAVPPPINVDADQGEGRTPTTSDAAPTEQSTRTAGWHRPASVDNLILGGSAWARVRMGRPSEDPVEVQQQAVESVEAGPAKSVAQVPRDWGSTARRWGT